jgi:hypothetical protein
MTMKRINIKDILYVDADKVQPGHIMHNGVILGVHKQVSPSGRKTIFWLETADASSWVEEGKKVPCLGVVSEDLLASIKKAMSDAQKGQVRYGEYTEDGHAIQGVGRA